MICPLCARLVKGPPDWADEVYHNSSCDCGDYSIDFWDKEIQQEIVLMDIGMRQFKIIFDRAKNETQLLECFIESRGFSGDREWTEHIVTVPSIKNIPGTKELEQKIKMWITFS